MISSAHHQAGTLRYTAAGLAIVIFWLLLGEFAIAMRERSALPSVLELLRRHHASDTTVSLLVTAFPSILGLCLGPIISYRSDRYRSRWGRRLPFMMAATPIGAAAMIGLAFCPSLGAAADRWLGAWSPGLDACVLGFFCLFWAIFECIVITTLALYAGLVNDVIPFPILGRFYGGFRVVSLSAGIVFNYWMFPLTDQYLSEVFAGIGILFGLGCMLMCAMVKEGEYPPPPEEPTGGAGGLAAIAREFMKECFSSPRYLWVFAALMLASVTFSPFNTFYQYYASSVGISKASLGYMSAVAYGISIVLAFCIGWLVDRYSAVRVSLAMLALYCVVSASGYLWVRDAHSFSVLYVAHVIISGAYFTAAASIPMALFPKMRFLQFNSAKDVMVSLATITIGILQGPVLDWSGHNYGLTLLSAAMLSLLGVACLLRVQAGLALTPAGLRPALPPTSA